MSIYALISYDRIIQPANADQKDHNHLLRKIKIAQQISLEKRQNDPAQIMLRNGYANGFLWVLWNMHDFLIVALCIAAIGFLFPYLESLVDRLDVATEDVEFEIAEKIKRYHEVLRA